VLYQLSYIGRTFKQTLFACARLILWFSSRGSVLDVVIPIRAGRELTPNPGFQREHAKNSQGHESNTLVADGRPSKNPQGNEYGQRNIQAIQSSLWCTGKDSNLRTS
jgi:hypothetical protein